MADRFAGEITIGGNVPAALLEKFLEQVRYSGSLVGDYDNSPFDAQTAEELQKALDGSGHLKLFDAEASYGMFEELEGFLRQHGIPFDRHSDGQYEFDCVNVVFRLGMERPLEMFSNKSGDTLVQVDEIRQVAKELASMATTEMSQGEMAAAVAKMAEKLNNILSPEVEPLPPLTVTE